MPTNIDLIEVGKNSYGVLNVINHSDQYRLKIGSFCSIAPEATFLVCGGHRVNCISSYPFKATFCNERFEALSKGDIIVEDDVWICYRTTIMSGVRIGRGAVIAAGSVVTKDVEPYSIVAGIPAKTIQYRFTKEQIEIINKIDYNTFDREKICDNIDLLYREIAPDDSLEWISRLM
jgi:acetyltransferase-like isoleucine patch superfamily enzyme